MLGSRALFLNDGVQQVEREKTPVLRQAQGSFFFAFSLAQHPFIYTGAKGTQFDSS
jgi:hypothetical protein